MYLNKNGIYQTPWSSGHEKCGLGMRLPFQIPELFFFVDLWYNTTSDHNEKTEAYSTGVAYNFTSWLSKHIDMKVKMT